MHRRILLSGAAAGPVFAAPALAQTQTPEVRWRLTSSFPRSLDILYGGTEVLARRVAHLTDNRFQIRTFPAGEIVPGLQVLDAAQNGTVECGQTALYFYTGKDTAFAFFTAIPFGLNTRQMTAWLRHGGGNEMCDELCRDYGIHAIPFGETGAQMGGWFRNEIRSLADLQGLKFRIAGFAGNVFQKLGSTPTQIAASDIYPSLERGTLDAAEFVGPNDDEKLGFARVARFYYAPGFWEASARGHLVINRRAWDALPPTYQAALDVACSEGVLDMVSRYDAANPVALRRLIAAGTQLRTWPREVMQAAWRASHELYEETGARNPRFKKIWESYRAFRGDQFQWFRVAENSLENFSYAAAAG